MPIYVYLLMKYDWYEHGCDGQDVLAVYTTEDTALKGLEIKVDDYEMEEDEAEGDIIKAYTNGELGFYVRRIELRGLDYHG